MRKILTISVVILLLLLTSAPVAAEQENTLTIDNPIIFGSDPQFPSPFTAYGPAVDNGLFCDSGTVLTLVNMPAGSPSGYRLTFHDIKLFECADESGSITVLLNAHGFIDDPSNVGTWNVLSGTGAYASLYGRGDQSGVPFVEGGGITDTYTGWVNK
jgi:hypothetical protein